jgi:small subunit ribosomal protein S20
LAHSSRTWKGARTPQALKRVRQSTRRSVILQPRRSAAKTEVKDALLAAASGDVEATRQAVAEAAAALDKAAKVGAIHPNNAARRKSRLMRRANAALGGEALVATSKPQRQVSKTAAAKAAKARIAAGKASKAKGEQTAAGKARAALSKSSRSADAGSPTKAGTEPVPAKAAPKAAPKAAAGTATKAKPAKKAPAAKASGTSTKSTTKATGSKSKTTTTE